LRFRGWGFRGRGQEVGVRGWGSGVRDVAAFECWDHYMSDVSPSELTGPGVCLQLVSDLNPKPETLNPKP
jgi:hypothetical protein